MWVHNDGLHEPLDVLGGLLGGSKASLLGRLGALDELDGLLGGSKGSLLGRSGALDEPFAVRGLLGSSKGSLLGRRSALDELRCLLLKVADELGISVNLAFDLVDAAAEELGPTVKGRSDQGEARQHAPACRDRHVQVAGEDLALVALDLVEYGSQRGVFEALAHIPEIGAQDLRQRVERREPPLEGSWRDEARRGGQWACRALAGTAGACSFCPGGSP